MICGLLIVGASPGVGFSWWGPLTVEASHGGGFSRCGLLMVGASHGGASHGGGFSRCGLLLLQSMGSRGSRFYLLRHVGSVVAAQGL